MVRLMDDEIKAALDSRLSKSLDSVAAFIIIYGQLWFISCGKYCKIIKPALKPKPKF